MLRPRAGIAAAVRNSPAALHRAQAILKALAVAYRRDWTAFQSLAGNNFFLATVFFLGKAGSFIYLILGLVLLFPLSTDPLRKIPACRIRQSFSSRAKK